MRNSYFFSFYYFIFILILSIFNYSCSFLMSKVDVKVVLLGKHSVGKTCLVERYLHGKFKDQTVATVGAAFGAKKMVAKGKEVTLGIWDTAGQERYESMSRIYYRSAKAAIVCYDLTEPRSFEKAKFWVDELMQNEEGCAIHLVGTKVDLIESGIARGNNAEEIKNYVQGIGAKSYETSSKSGIGIEIIFQDIADAFVEGKVVVEAPKESNTKVNPTDQLTIKEKKKCCA